MSITANRGYPIPDPAGAIHPGVRDALVAIDSDVAAIIAGAGGALVTSVFGRTGIVTAATNDYDWAQINKTTSSLADLATRSAGDLSSGTLLAARMPALTGEVTTSVGSVATTITNNAVTLAKLADIATASFLGRNTVGTGDPEVLSTATAKTMLNLAGTNTGDVTLSGESYLSLAGQALTANQISLAGTHVINTLPVNKGGTGTATPFTAGSLVFAGTSGVYSQNNASLFWDNTNGRLGLGTASPGQRLEVSGNILVNNGTANLYLKDTSTGWQSAATTVITPQASNAIRSTAYTSGLIGWNISAVGNAEFNNVDIRGAIHAGLIVYNALQATAGTLGVFKSAAKLRSDVTVPASPTYGTTTAEVHVVDPDGLSHAASQMFFGNEIIRIKDGLVGDTWFKVSAVVDNGTHYSYGLIIMAGSANVTYRAGLGVANYGLSGQGFIIQTADQTNSPYIQMATHPATFTSQDAGGTLNVTPRLRIGNLNGSYGYAADTFGFGAGQYGVASSPWLTVDATHGIRIGNNTTVNGQWGTDGEIVVGPVAAGLNNIRLSPVNGLQLRTNTTVVIGMGFSGDLIVGQATAGQSNVLINAGQIDIRNNTTSRIRLASDGSGFLANSSISWDTSGNLTVAGNATIAGWTIATTKITSTGIDLHSGASAALAFGATPPTSAGAGTGIWLDRTGLYGLASNVVQAKMDAATGVITAGGGRVILNADGLSISDTDIASASQIKWTNVANGFDPATISGVDVANAEHDGLFTLFVRDKNLTETARVDLVTIAASNRSLLQVYNGTVVKIHDTGTGVVPSTALHVDSTTGAFLPPRMTTTQRDALTPTDGMMIYNSTLSKFQGRAGGAWVDLH